MSMLQQPLVFVDIETNGFNHVRGRVIEVAAIRVESGHIVREFRSLIDPGTPLPQFITNLTGIAQRDLTDAPLFMAIADELLAIMDGAIFVAHNVRFDYSFLKQEFRRIGKDFLPRQLCTVRLSRQLFPEHKSHKLQYLITRHNLQVSARHRAYDDAHALWQFVQLVQSHFPADVIEQAVAKQIKQPALPKALQSQDIAALPAGASVYIMYDESGAPLYVGKSIHVRQRVMEHFMRDHNNAGEFKLAQRVHSITAQQTAGELEALLLESRLVKELLPYHNKKLRKTAKLLVVGTQTDDAGYVRVRVDTASADALPGDALGVYDRRSNVRAALERAARDWNLCPALLGLEKTQRGCFWSQLGKCRGACTGKELASIHNARLFMAFGRQKSPWPYKGPVLVQEHTTPVGSSGLVVDKWCVVGTLRQDDGCQPVFERYEAAFDIDAYNILRTYLLTKAGQLTIKLLPREFTQHVEVV